MYDTGEGAMASLEAVLNPWTFALHFHNLVARGNEGLKIHPNQPLYKMFQRHCPMTFKNEVEGQVGKVWMPASGR